jgi:hypothetical protein
MVLLEAEKLGNLGTRGACLLGFGGSNRRTKTESRLL